MSRKFKKSIWIPLALFIYTTAMAIYFIPGNTDMSSTEKYCTIAFSYIIIALLWWVNHKKEKIARQREEDMMNGAGGL